MVKDSYAPPRQIGTDWKPKWNDTIPLGIPIDSDTRMQTEWKQNQNRLQQNQMRIGNLKWLSNQNLLHRVS